MAGSVSSSGGITRVTGAETSGNWYSIGGGQSGSVENSFVYQGNSCYNRKVTSTLGAGFYYSSPSVYDLVNGNRKTFLAKIMVTDKDGLQTANGVSVQIGSSSSAYHEFIVAGSSSPVSALSEYPIKGGWLIVPIDPNVLGYRASTTGSPSLTSVDYFGLVTAFRLSTAKSENVGMDAIDLVDYLTVVNGTVGSPATFDDFVNWDEGNVNSRYGMVTTNNGVIFVYGKLKIGSTAAVVFNDSNKTIVFPDGMFAEGFTGIELNLFRAETDINLSGISFTGRGNADIEETRPVFNTLNSTGVATVDACTFESFNTITLTAGVVFKNSQVNNTVSFLQAGAAVESCVFNKPDVATSVAFMTVDDPAKIKGCSFYSSGTGHAIELTPDCPTSITFDSNKFFGYGANDTGDAAVYNNSGKSVDISVIGGGDSNFTIRNGAGASTSVAVSAILTINNLQPNTEVRIFRSSDGTVLDGVEDATVVDPQNSGRYKFDYNYSIVEDIYIQVINLQYEIIRLEYSLDGTNQTLPVKQRFDRNYSNPVSPK